MQQVQSKIRKYITPGKLSEYLCFLQKIRLAASFLEHLLHSLPLNGHPHSPGTHSRLDPYQSLHAPECNRGLLPHLPASDESLQPHYSLQSPQRSSGLNLHIINTELVNELKLSSTTQINHN